MFNIRKLFFNAARWFFAAAPGKTVATHSLADVRKPYRIPYPRPSRSKYMPHQGKRERLRRRIPGFAGIAKLATTMGKTRDEVLQLYARIC